MQHAFITELPPIVNNLLVWEYRRSTDSFQWLCMNNSEWQHYIMLPQQPLDLYSGEAAGMLHERIDELLSDKLTSDTYNYFATPESLTLLLPEPTEDSTKDKCLGILLESRSGITDPLNFIADKTIRQVLNFLPIDLVLFDTQQRFLFITDHAIKDKETRDWLIGKTEIDFFERRNRPLDLPLKRQEYFREMMETKQTVSYMESDLVRGKRVHKSRSFHPILNSAGEIYLVVGYGIETTHIVEKEMVINRQNMAIEKASDGVALLDKNGNYYYLNDAHVKFFGYESAEELIGQSWKKLYGAEELERIDREIFPLIGRDGNWTGETVGLHKNGSPVYQEITLSILPEGELLCICRDFSERKKQADEIRKLALVVENTNSVVIITDQDDRIEWVNKAFTSLTEYTLEEVVGKNPSEFLDGKDTDPQVTSLFKQQLSTQSSAQCEALNYKKSGKPYWVRIQAQPLTDASGKVFKYFSIMQDITYQKNIERDLIVAKEAAEASARSKRRFLANMSHEIRTPMNAILGLTEQLLKTDLSNDQRFLSDTISQAANNLLAVINDVLDISKMEEGKVQIEHIPMNPKQVIERAINVLLHKAEEKGLKLVSKLDTSLDKDLLGDPYRINQVLLNVIGNGIKFTNKGEVCVEGSLQQTGTGSLVLAVQVCDTGIGMDEEMKSNIFNEFTQGDQSFVRKYGGTGLGLSITKNLITLMNGSIKIDSTQGFGTKVVIQIPYTNVAEETVIAVTGPEILDRDFTGKTVMLVEDNKFNSLLASMILKKAGVTTLTSVNGKEAIEKLSKTKVDLILMDIQMPEIDGVTATSILRTDYRLETPIIALTAHALREEKDIYLCAGMNDFLSKPFTENELLRILSKWIQ